MNNFLEQKKNILIEWLLRNNIDIQNTMNAQIGVQDYQREAIFNANVITSVLLKEKIFDSGFDGLENLLETDAKVIVDLRKCDKMEDLLNILNSSEFRNIGSTFSANQVLGIYNREKESANFNQNVNNHNYEQNKETNAENLNQKNNKYEKDDYLNYNQRNFNSNQYQNRNSKQYQNNEQKYNDRNNYNNFQYQNNNKSYENNINQFNQGYNDYNYSGYQNQNKYYDEFKDNNNYLHSNGEHNKEIICEHGLNHVINGVKTITHKLSDGNYSFEMVIPVGYKGDTQSVNKKVLTKNEHERFIDTYQDEILGISKDYSHGKEINMELEDDSAYRL